MRTVVDLHPEELLDRDARGELPASDRQRLDAHLARCPACRFEQQLRGDFAGELASDVTASSVERLTLASVSQPRATARPRYARRGLHLKTLQPPPESLEDERPQVLPCDLHGSLTPPAARPRRRVTRATWLFAAAAVFAVSIAGATSTGQNAWSRLVGSSGARAAETEVAPPPVRAAKHAVRYRAVAPGGPSAAELAPPMRDEVPSVDFLAPPAASPARAPHASTARAASAASAAYASPPSASYGAASLFDAANDARRRADYGRALVLQRDLQSRFPHSYEAHVARATLGRLLLDRGDPGGALANFDAYLAGGSGELGEEAMVGRATALERLGRTREAGGAWQALLAAYPATPYAAHAKARLGGSSVR